MLENSFVYELSDGKFVSIDTLGKNLNTVYIPPNSMTMTDLANSEYCQALLNQGYTEDMFAYDEHGQYKDAKTDKPYRVKRRFHLHSTSDRKKMTAKAIANNIENFYVNDNPTLIAEIIAIGMIQRLNDREVMFSTRWRNDRTGELLHASEIGQRLHRYKNIDDERLINCLIHIGYKEKLIALGIITYDYETDTSIEDFEGSVNPLLKPKKRKGPAGTGPTKKKGKAKKKVKDNSSDEEEEEKEEKKNDSIDDGKPKRANVQRAAKGVKRRR